MSTSPSGDRIYGFTKFVAALLGIVVFFAFIVLYFFPTRTKQLFAWPIAPPMTAMFMGASYANGAIFFSALLLGKKWHRVWAPHIGVFMFATLLLIATILHWDRFNHAHPAWLIPHWPWKTTPLTMRVIVSFYSMLGVAVFAVVREPRWSAWRVGAIGVIVWHALILVAALRRQGDFKGGLFHGWWFPFEL